MLAFHVLTCGVYSGIQVTLTIHSSVYNILKELLDILCPCFLDQPLHIFSCLEEPNPILLFLSHKTEFAQSPKCHLVT